MWIFRSSINKRQPMVAALQNMRREAKERLLEPLWQVAAGPLDEWSKTFVRKRFY